MSNSPSSLLGHGWQPGGAETTRSKKLDLLHRLVFERHRHLWVQKCLVARTPFFLKYHTTPPPSLPSPTLGCDSRKNGRGFAWHSINGTAPKRRRRMKSSNYYWWVALVYDSNFLMFGHSNVTALLLRHALEDSYKPSFQLKVIEDCIQFSICILTTPNRERNHGEHFRNGIRIIKQLVSRLTTAHCAWLCHPRSY